MTEGSEGELRLYRKLINASELFIRRYIFSRGLSSEETGAGGGRGAGGMIAKDYGSYRGIIGACDAGEIFKSIGSSPLEGEIGL